MPELMAKRLNACVTRFQNAGWSKTSFFRHHSHPRCTPEVLWLGLRAVCAGRCGRISLNECHFVQECKSKELKEGLMSVTNSVLPPGRIFLKWRTFYKHYLCLIPVLTKVFKWAEVWSPSFRKGWEARFRQGLTSFRKLLTYYETKIQV